MVLSDPITDKVTALRDHNCARIGRFLKTFSPVDVVEENCFLSIRHLPSEGLNGVEAHLKFHLIFRRKFTVVLIQLFLPDPGEHGTARPVGYFSRASRSSRTRFFRSAFSLSRASFSSGSAR